MKTWFADTYFFLALLDKGDEGHARVVALGGRAQTGILTTTHVLTEVANALSAPSRRQSYCSLVRLLQSDKNAIVVEVGRELFDKGENLYCQRPDKGWSLTDCISFILMQERHLTEALTGDHHFEQAGFMALLK